MQKVIAEYVWLDGYGKLRSKIKILPGGEHYSIKNIPIWNFNGTSTKQGNSQNSEVILHPIQLYNNPFHKDGYLILCDIYVRNEHDALYPHQSNTRYKALEYFQYDKHYQPWFGFEQEYYILTGSEPPASEGMYYCGNDPELVLGRKLAEEHLYACLQAGLTVSGINAENGPGQWEYQIGPVAGLQAADQLWISRFILERLAERSRIRISFHPKPLGSNWSGSGCHINFSTIQMRSPGGYANLLETLHKLQLNHNEYIKYCGDDTTKRLTGDHDTAMIANFNWGIGSRNTSIRIPKETVIQKGGYFEDRRPSANMDPYILCTHLIRAVLPEEN